MNTYKAVLGVLVGQPNYPYAVAQKLGHKYARSAVYETVKSLLDLGLIEPVEMPETLRPRKWYRATVKGQALYAEQIAKVLWERHELFDQFVMRYDASSEVILTALDEYEALIHSPGQREDSGGNGVVAQLLASERRMVNDARLSWVRQARRTIALGVA